MFPDDIEQGEILPSCFRSHTVNKRSFCGPFSAVFFTLLCFVLVNLLFKMSPVYSAEVLSSVAKHKKATMCLTEKIQVLENLPSARCEL